MLLISGWGIELTAEAILPLHFSDFLLMKLLAQFLGCFFVLANLCLSAVAADFKDVEYGQVDGVHLTLDAHVPDGDGPFPAAILVHGGGWVAGDKQQYITYIFQPLSGAGFAWFSINYRLAPQFKFPADADDVESAIRFVKANAAKYKVDAQSNRTDWRVRGRASCFLCGSTQPIGFTGCGRGVDVRSA